eukprot:811786-Pleurochrysis_carterae.AAC.1
MINRANAAARAANKENAAADSELEAQVQRLNEGRICRRRASGGRDEAHGGGGGAPRSTGAGRPAGKRAVEPQQEGRQGAAGAGKPALPLQGVRREGRELPGALQPQ